MEGTAALEEPVLYRFVRVIRDGRDRADRCPDSVRSIELETLQEWCLPVGKAGGFKDKEKIPQGFFTEYELPPGEVPWEQVEPHPVLFVMPRERPQDVRLHLFFMVHDVELDKDGVFVDPLTLPVSLWIPGSFLHEHIKKAFRAAGISLRHLTPPDDLVLRQKIVQAEKRLQEAKKGFGSPPPEGQVKAWAVDKVRRE